MKSSILIGCILVVLTNGLSGNKLPIFGSVPLTPYGENLQSRLIPIPPNLFGFGEFFRRKNAVRQSVRDVQNIKIRLENLEESLPLLRDEVIQEATQAISDVFTTLCDSNRGQIVEGHCYSYESSTVTFEVAKNYCIYKGGHLAVPSPLIWPTSQFQDSFVVAFGSNLDAMWIGMEVITLGVITGLDGVTLTQLDPIGAANDMGPYSLTINGGTWQYNVNPIIATTTTRSHYLCEYL